MFCVVRKKQDLTEYSAHTEFSLMSAVRLVFLPRSLQHLVAFEQYFGELQTLFLRKRGGSLNLKKNSAKWQLNPIAIIN